MKSEVVLKQICSIIIEEVVIEFSKIIDSVLLEYCATLPQCLHVSKRAIDYVPVRCLDHYWCLICDYIFEGIVAQDILDRLNLIVIKDVTVAIEVFEDTILKQKGPIEARTVLTIKMNDVRARCEIFLSDRNSI